MKAIFLWQTLGQRELASNKCAPPTSIMQLNEAAVSYGVYRESLLWAGSPPLDYTNTFCYTLVG